MEWVPWEQLDRVGPWALALVIVFAFMRGLIVPGQLAQKQLDSALEEARTWRSAFFTEQEMRRDLEQTGRIVRTTFQALPAPEEKT